MRYIYIPLHPRAREIMKAHFMQPTPRLFKEDHYGFMFAHSTCTPMGVAEDRLYIDQDYKILMIREKTR